MAVSAIQTCRHDSVVCWIATQTRIEEMEGSVMTENGTIGQVTWGNDVGCCVHHWVLFRSRCKQRSVLHAQRMGSTLIVIEVVCTAGSMYVAEDGSDGLPILGVPIEHSQRCRR